MSLTLTHLSGTGVIAGGLFGHCAETDSCISLMTYPTSKPFLHSLIFMVKLYSPCIIGLFQNTVPEDGSIPKAELEF